jgi:AcrR family transcriptional regulator
MKERILEEAGRRFFREGFARVSMDDLAGELGISKKTIYQHYSSKEELLERLMGHFIQGVDQEICRILDERQVDFIEKLTRVFALLAGKLSHLSPAFARDLQKHAPATWRKVDERRSQILQRNFGRLMAEGIKQQAFRRGFDPQFFLLIYLTLVRQIINPESLLQLSVTPREAFENIVSILMEGVLSEEARKHFKPRKITLDIFAKDFATPL